MTTAPNQEIDFDYTKYGFRDEENYTYKSEKGLNEKVVRTLLEDEGRAGVDAQAPLAGRSRSTSRSRCRPRAPGRIRSWPSLTTRISTTMCALARRPAEAGTMCRRPSATPSRSWASPKPSRSSWPVSAHSTSPRASITRCARNGKSWA